MVKCFIRKNTPILRERIKKRGIDTCLCFNFKNAVWLVASILDNKVHGLGHFEDETKTQEILDTFVRDFKDYIDCKENEELFLALISLRDDTDAWQWFIDDNNPDYWEMTEDDLPSRYMQMNGHKASVEELIDHFDRYIV